MDRFCSSFDTEYTYEWFSRDIQTGSAIYFLAGPLRDHITRFAREQDSELLLQPFIIDPFVADQCSRLLWEEMIVPRNELLTYARIELMMYAPRQPLTSYCQEHRGAANFRSAQGTDHAFEDLHRISQVFHIIHVRIVNCEQSLEFLIKTKEICDTAGGVASGQRSHSRLRYHASARRRGGSRITRTGLTSASTPSSTSPR
jgi:hypothetical protein